MSGRYRPYFLLIAVCLTLAACAGAGESTELGGAEGLAPHPGEPNYSQILVDSVTELDFIDAEEIDRAWRAAWVRVPDGFPLSGALSTEDLDEVSSIVSATGDGTSDQRRWPVAIWLHGCEGLWQGTMDRLDWLASLGYVAIAPDSPSRRFYPQSCDSTTASAGLYRPTLQIRQIDAAHALWQVHGFAWAATNDIVLGGFSEGGAATATLDLTSHVDIMPRARVIESWGCHSGWSEFFGLAASDREPVISLVAVNDPWYDTPWQRGDCGEFMNRNNGSESIVVDWTPLRDSHVLLSESSLRELVANYLIQGKPF